MTGKKFGSIYDARWQDTFIGRIGKEREKPWATIIANGTVNINRAVFITPVDAEEWIEFMDVCVEASINHIQSTRSPWRPQRVP